MASPEQNIQTSLGLLTQFRNILEDDYSYIEQHFSPDHVWHDPAAPDLPQNIEGVKQFMKQYAVAFPDLQIIVNQVFAADDKVVSQWTSAGTNTGPFGGGPATGKAIRVEGMTIDRYDDQGMQVESWNVWDTLGFMQQLGLISTADKGAQQPASAAEEQPGIH